MADKKSELIENVKIGEEVLSMKNITKIYNNGFVANQDVSFSINKVEIVGLLGENGAGKTTLMKILFGLEKPEKGEIYLGGQQVKINGPVDALEYGIGMVHQHFMLIDTLTVAENMVLGAETGKGFLFDIDQARKLTQEVSDKYNLAVDPNMLVKDLSVGYKQRVEILKMLLRGAKIILLDEPTAVLTPQETVELFAQLKKLKESGFSFVFISHKLKEVKEICDRITILRLGKVTGSANVADVTERDMSRMMVGRDVILDIEKEKAQPKESVLKVRDISYVNKFDLYSYQDLSFDVRQGEILGIAGVEGNGQSELADSLAGLITPQKGEITVKGQSIIGKSIKKIRSMGVALVHEDRQQYGVSSLQSISENLLADDYKRKSVHTSIFFNSKKIKEHSDKLINEFSIKCDDAQAKVKTLSGGNVQKVVAAREFSDHPKLLVVSQPTRGIDVGAAELIRKKIIALRDEGTAVALFSADLNEVLTVSDSIIVMHKGKIVAYFPDASKVDENTLGEYMLGIKEMSKEEIGGVCCDKED